MGEEQAFLKAIAEADDDHSPRLIYADWLEERGDPRAELIRIAEERRALDPASDRAWELRPQLRDLEGCAEQLWLGQMGYQTYRPLFLKVPEERRLRWRLAVEFFESWWGQSVESLDEAAMARLERELTVQLPLALRGWLTLLGMKSWRIAPEFDALLFEHLSDRLGAWGIRRADLSSEEPPVVFVHQEQHEVRTAYQRFSDFALKRLISGGMDWSNNLHAFGDCHPSEVDEFRAMAFRCDFPADELGEFYEAPGMIAEITGRTGTDLHIGCRPDETYKRLSQGLLYSLRLLTEEEEAAYIASLG